MPTPARMGAVCGENSVRVGYVKLLGPPIRGVLLEKLLRHHAIDQQHRIHRFRHAEVDAHAGDRISLRRRYAGLRLQQLDRLPHGLFHCDVEIDVKSERVIVGGVLRARPAHGLAGALVQDELQCAGELLFERAAVDLTVALYAVRIASEEERPLVKDGDVEG